MAVESRACSIRAILTPTAFNVVRSYFGSFDRDHPGQDALTRMIYSEFRLRLPELLLMRVDKIGMSESLEARVPFLDHHLVEFTMDIPEGWKIRGRRPQISSEEGRAKALFPTKSSTAGRWASVRRCASGCAAISVARFSRPSDRPGSCVVESSTWSISTSFSIGIATAAPTAASIFGACIICTAWYDYWVDRKIVGAH